MGYCRFLSVLLITCIMMFPAVPYAQEEAQQEEIAQPIADWKADLDRLEKALEREFLTSEDLDQLREQLEKTRTALIEYADKLRPSLELAKAQLEKLGAAPKEGEPAEPEAVAAQRKTLTERYNAIDAAIKGASALRLRAVQLSERVQDRRRTLFTQSLFKRSRTPLSISLWADAASNLEGGFKRLSFLLSDWWGGLESHTAFFTILFGSAITWLVLTFLCWWGVQRFRAWDEAGLPPFWRRAASAAWVIILRAFPTVATAGAAYLALRSWELLPERIDTVAAAIVQALAIVAAVGASSTTLLAPKRPFWRIFPVSDDSAKRIRWRVIGIAVVYAADLVLNALHTVLFSPLPLIIAQSSVTSILFALLLAATLAVPMRGQSPEGAPQIGSLNWLRIPIFLIALTIFLATLTGYVAFARFLAAQVVVTGTILVIVYLLLVWINAVGQRLREAPPEPRWGTLEAHEKRRRGVALAITLLLKALVFAGAIPLILLQWGFDWQDLRIWMAKAFFGFQIGHVTISIATVLTALLVFLVAYAIARILQSWIDSQVLGPAGLSSGVRDSIRTGIGYLGVIAAALIGISVTGVDFSNLAIVAGALSVGIGFGLQSIVNNFVSGLILLAERPIKVGDWVIVGEDQGYVRRISVRATEIETFDRSNIIIPNSLLISEKVKNWTLHNNIGRVIIPVGVSYDSNPEQVRDILLEVARNHPQVLSHPEPFVYFEDFGNSALNFSLYAYVLNITQSISVRTDLRIAILKAFRAAGIEIPFPQTDVHFKDLEWLKKALAQQLARLREEEESGDELPLPPGLPPGKSGPS